MSETAKASRRQMTEPLYHRTSDVPGLTEAIAQYGKAGEKIVVAEIVALLERKGFRKPVEGNEDSGLYYVLAQQRSARTAGSDAGVPDIVVMAGWKKCLPLEVKGREKDARISPSQWMMYKAGALQIVNCAAQVEDLLAAL